MASEILVWIECYLYNQSDQVWCFRYAVLYLSQHMWKLELNVSQLEIFHITFLQSSLLVMPCKNTSSKIRQTGFIIETVYILSSFQSLFFVDTYVGGTIKTFLSIFFPCKKTTFMSVEFNNQFPLEIIGRVIRKHFLLAVG